MMRRALPLVLAAVLAACPAGSRRGSGERPARGGILQAALAEDVDFLDPQRAGQPAAFTVLRALHRGLMAFPPLEGRAGSAPVPDLAEGPPEASADGLNYRFRLRGGVAFGEPANRPVVAGDVRAGLERLLRPGAPSPLARYFGIIVGADAFAAGRAKEVSGIATPDERTVTIRLVRPYNDLPWILALPAASAVPAEIAGTAIVPPSRIAPSGPYRLDPKDGYRPESGIHLIRNGVWRADADPVRKAWVEEIRVTIGVAPADIASGIASGRYDLSLDAPPPPDTREGGRVHSVPSGCVRYLWLNTRMSPFDDGAFRRAVAGAVDREAVRAVAGDPRSSVVTSSLLPRTVYGRPPDPASSSPSPTGSATRAATPGARPIGQGGTVRLVSGDRPEDVAVARVVAESLRQALGLRVTVTGMPIASLYVDGYEVPARKIQMGIATWCADWPGLAGRAAITPVLDGRRIPATGNDNYAQLHNPGLERLLDVAALAPPVRAEAAWTAAAVEAARLAPWVPLLDLNEVSLASERVRGFVGSPMYPRGDLTALWLRPGEPDGTLRPATNRETPS